MLHFLKFKNHFFVFWMLLFGGFYSCFWNAIFASEDISYSFLRAFLSLYYLFPWSFFFLFALIFTFHIENESQFCPTLCNPMGCTDHGILQARILEWVAFPFSGGSSQPRDWTQVSCIAGRFFYQLSCKGNPRVMEWVAYPFSRGSSRSRNQTEISHIASGFFTNWALREAHLSHQSFLMCLAVLVCLLIIKIRELKLWLKSLQMWLKLVNFDLQSGVIFTWVTWREEIHVNILKTFSFSLLQFC